MHLLFKKTRAGETLRKVVELDGLKPALESVRLVEEKRAAEGGAVGAAAAVAVAETATATAAAALLDTDASEGDAAAGDAAAAAAGSEGGEGGGGDGDAVGGAAGIAAPTTTLESNVDGAEVGSKASLHAQLARRLIMTARQMSRSNLGGDADRSTEERAVCLCYDLLLQQRASRLRVADAAAAMESDRGADGAGADASDGQPPMLPYALQSSDETGTAGSAGEVPGPEWAVDDVRRAALSPSPRSGGLSARGRGAFMFTSYR